MEKISNKFKAGGLLTLVAVGFIAASLFLFQFQSSVVVEPVWMEEFPLKPLRDADPGVGASGVLTVFCYPHSGDPGVTYVSNITDGWYAQGDDNNTHIGSDVPYDTAFDVVYKVRWNKTHAYNVTDTEWWLGWVKGFANSTVLGAASVAMLEYNITGCVATDFVWVHYVDNNGGAGYTINRGENVTSYIADFSSYYS